MAYNSINNFLSEVRFAGLAKPNRFEVMIANPPCVQNGNWGRRVSMFCDQTSLPVAQIITARQQLFGPPEFLPVGIDFGGQSFGMQFYVDRQMTVKQYFDLWVQGIIDPVTYVANYQNNYITTIWVNQLDEADNVNYSIQINGAYPTVVAPLNVDHSQANTVHKLSVTFAFRNWTVAPVTSYFDDIGAPAASSQSFFTSIL